MVRVAAKPKGRVRAREDLTQIQRERMAYRAQFREEREKREAGDREAKQSRETAEREDRDRRAELERRAEAEREDRELAELIAAGGPLAKLSRADKAIEFLAQRARAKP